MKKYDFSDLFMSFWLGSGAVLLLLIAVKPTKQDLKHEAIERGHAEYVVGSDGKTTWKWKEKQ